MAAAFQLTPIAENLRREELVLQIADRLQLIQTLAETLFDRVDSRLTAVSARLEDIDRRSSVCGRKIAQVKTDEGRATTLYSHHKYPAEEIGTAEMVDGLLADDRGYSLEEELKRRLAAKPNCSAKKYEQISSTHIPYDDDAKVKSQFFIYDKVPNKRLIPDQLSDEAIPWGSITSLSSLLLFNSSVNAYTIGRHAQLGRGASSRGARKGGGPRSLASSDSPDSASLNAVPQTQSVEDPLNFALSFQAAPELLGDLPSALPSLPGIADEAFRGLFDGLLPNDELGGGSESGALLFNLPDLAHMNSSSRFAASSTSALSLPSVPTLSLPSSSSSAVPPTPPSGAPPPPPPPTPPPPPSMDIPEPPTSPQPPPPPPPQTSTTAKQQTPETTTSSSSPAEGGRASLLDAIRKAGGRPTKKTIKERKAEEKLKKREEEEESSKKKVVTAEPLDMMAELQRRLQSRRTGISKDSEGGSQKQPRNLGPLPALSNKSIGAQAMDNVMAKIPEPRRAPASSDEEDDDDDDDDDWAD